MKTLICKQETQDFMLRKFITIKRFGRTMWMKLSEWTEQKLPSEMEPAYAELYNNLKAFILKRRQPMTVKCLCDKFEYINEIKNTKIPDHRTVLKKEKRKKKNILKTGLRCLLSSRRRKPYSMSLQSNLAWYPCSFAVSEIEESS